MADSHARERKQNLQVLASLNLSPQDLLNCQHKDHKNKMRIPSRGLGSQKAMRPILLLT